MQALISRGVIGDFRAPDLMRFGFAPLYNSYPEIFRAAEVLGGHPRFAGMGPAALQAAGESYLIGSFLSLALSMLKRTRARRGEIEEDEAEQDRRFAHVHGGVKAHLGSGPSSRRPPFRPQR